MAAEAAEHFWEHRLYQLLFCFVFCLFLGSYLCTPLSNPEIYWHLTLGRWIWGNAALPTVNLWTDVAVGSPWLDSNWLFNLLLLGSEAFWGEKGPTALKLIAFVGLVSAVLWFFFQVSKDLFAAGFFSALVSAGVLVDKPLTSTLFALPLMLLLFGFSRKLCSSSASSSGGSRRALLPLLLTAILYSNIDGSYSFAAVAALLLFSFSPKLVPGSRLRLLAVLLLPLFLPPYFGAHLLQSTGEFVNSLRFELLFDRSPGTVFDFEIVFLLILMMVAASFPLSRLRSLQPLEIFVVLSVTVLSLASKDLSVFALPLMGYLVCRLWSREQELGNVGLGILKLSESLRQIRFYRGLVFLMLCIAIVHMTQLLRRPVLNEILPKQEVDYFIGQEGRLLHSPQIAGYLIHRFSDAKGLPNRRALIDQRSVFLDTGAYTEWLSYSKLQPGWGKFVERAAPDYVLCFLAEKPCALFQEHPSWEAVEFLEDGVPRFSGWQLFRSHASSGVAADSGGTDSEHR